MSQLFVFAVLGLGLLIFFLPAPRKALRNYLWLLPFLPEYIVTDIAGVSVTSTRAASIMLLLALAVRHPHRLLPRIDWMDTGVLLFLAAYLFAVVPTPPMSEGLVFGAGFVLDTFVPYYLFRAVIRSSDDLRYLIPRMVSVTYVVLALAAFQSVTEWNFFDIFKSAGVFGAYDSGMIRLGLFRADVGLTHYIMMGLWFAFHLPLGIGHYAGIGLDFGRVFLRCIHLPFGSFFSLSGASFMVTGLGLGTYLLYPLRRIWLLGGVLLVLGIAYVEIFSNRGFLEILAAYTATDADSAWYRIRLPDAVFAKMPEHWIWGYGRQKPPMGQYNDITNQYLFFLLHSGLVTMGAFIGCFGIAFQRLLRAGQIALSRYLRLLSWGIGAALLAHACGLITVSLFGQMKSYLFLLFAIAAAARDAALEDRRRFLWLVSPIGRRYLMQVREQLLQKGPVVKIAPESKGGTE